MMTLDSRSSFPFEAPPQLGPVRVSANRNRVEARFPVLGFTVQTGGRPYFEVVLATARRLFDPANAGQRSASSFYESRRDNNLMRAESDGSLFVVPASVVQAFVAAGATEIFYTAAGYDSAQGANPVYAHPVEQLVTSAPSVAVAEDMRTKTMSAVLSVSLDRLLRVCQGSPGYAGQSYQAFAAMTDADDDRAEGEDGYEAHSAGFDYDDGYENDGGSYAAQGYAAEGDAAVSLASYADDDEEDDAGAYSAQGAVDELTPEERADAEPVQQASAYASDEYDDGYDEPIAAQSFADAATPSSPYAEDAYVSAQSSVYPAGAQAPDMLEDEDEGERYDAPAAGAAADDDGIALAAAYGDDDDDDPEYQPLSAPATAAPAAPLTEQDQRRIIEAVAQLYSGPQRFAAMAANPGRTARGCPVGLAWGHLLFTQESGDLGELLKTMNARDHAAFMNTFGAQWNDLLAVACNTTPGANGCSSRVQPVASANLWDEPWRARFHAAAALPQFQAAQNETAATLYLQPLLPFASGLGLRHARSLAILLDRRVEMGAEAALQWLAGAASPLQTLAQRQQALAELGVADVSAFQGANNLQPTGTWDPLTHAAAVKALRARGRSPVPLPDDAEVVNLLVRRAQGTAWQQRTQSLATLPDVVYAF